MINFDTIGYVSTLPIPVPWRRKFDVPIPQVILKGLFSEAIAY